MKHKMIVTNLRIPEQNYLAVKAMAAESGMSLNEYLNELADISAKKKFFGIKVGGIQKKSKSKTIYEALWNIANKPYSKKPMGANEDDKIIYGINDE